MKKIALLYVARKDIQKPHIFVFKTILGEEETKKFLARMFDDHSEHDLQTLYDNYWWDEEEVRSEQKT